HQFAVLDRVLDGYLVTDLQFAELDILADLKLIASRQHKFTPRHIGRLDGTRLALRQRKGGGRKHGRTQRKCYCNRYLGHDSNSHRRDGTSGSPHLLNYTGNLACAWPWAYTF